MLPKWLKATLVATLRLPYTFDWPLKPNVPLPDIDLEQASLGPLRIGSHIDGALFLGRPSSCVSSEWGSAIFYDSLGIQLDFDRRRRFALVRFFVSPDSKPPRPSMVLCKPNILRRGRLTSDTSERTIVSLFGKPNEQVRSSDEMILSYHVRTLELEFYLSRRGQLSEFTLQAYAE